MAKQPEESVSSPRQKFQEVFQPKQGQFSELPPRISEMVKSNTLDSAPTQSLLSVVNGILGESIKGQNSSIPDRVACLLRKVVQEIERRISTQAEHIRNQNNLFKAREEKYQSRIKVLETLATGASEGAYKEAKDAEEELLKEKEEWNLTVCKLNSEIEMKNKTLQQLHTLLEIRNKEATKGLMKDKENSDIAIAKLQEMEMVNRSYEKQCLQLENQIKESKDEIVRLKQASDVVVSKLQAEIETKNKLHEQSLELTSKLDEVKRQLEEKKKELQESRSGSGFTIEELRKRCKELEEKDNIHKKYAGYQLQALQELKLTSSSIKSEVMKSQKCWHEEYAILGRKLKELAGAAAAFHKILAENRRLYNEVQELKGNIRVFCRIRPFLPGENGKLSTVDYIGENGELLVANPSKQGKDGHRTFKFNKVFGPQASQEEVYFDTQPFIRSALDGFNVCIFAYGQTGSGKTYTMSGPTSAAKETWGVNYRALNDLFNISQSRSNAFNYEIDVQMVEIYNEQVRDLLSCDTSQKKLGIRSTSQPNGLAVPDASMYPVNSTNDVLELMEVGHANRAMSSTALNERSSRSHSILSIHVRGADLKTAASLRGCLHLVDLAGSERVDRSEVTGERLREAQHINKSLSALGDVIYALSQKNSHVPYRNSKLTQLLQNSLGGQAKTLMFVQVNPDMDSYSETLSTLKFAERASGVELGAAKSNKEGKDVKELMEQVTNLKDLISTKDEEIERLHILKEFKNQNPQAKTQVPGNNSLNHSLSSPSLHHVGNVDKVSDMEQQSQSKTTSHPKSPLGIVISARNPRSFQEDYDDSEADILGGSQENLEAEKAADNSKLKLRSQGPRSPTQRTRLTARTPTKLKESPKSPLSPRRTITGQTSAAKSSPTSKRWH